MDESGSDLSFLLLRAFYDLRGMLDRMITESGLQGEVRPGMGPLLYALYEEEDCTVSELSARVGLAVSTLTNTLKRMERDDLVSLQRDAGDRRVVRVTLTKKARALEDDMVALRQRVRGVLGSNLTKSEFQSLAAGLGRIIDAMEIDAWEAAHPSKDGRAALS